MPPRVQLAITLTIRGAAKGRRTSLEGIIAMAPNRAESYYVLGTQFREMGDLPEASALP